MRTRQTEILSVQVTPAFEIPRTLHLENRPEAGQALRYCVVVRGEDNDSGRESVVAVSREDTQRLIDLMKESRIPLIVAGQIGVDGISYEIEFVEGFTSGIYGWWGEPPEGWEPLGEIAGIVDRYWTAATGTS